MSADCITRGITQYADPHRQTVSNNEYPFTAPISLFASRTGEEWGTTNFASPTANAKAKPKAAVSVLWRSRHGGGLSVPAAPRHGALTVAVHGTDLDLDRERAHGGRIRSSLPPPGSLAPPGHDGGGRIRSSLPPRQAPGCAIDHHPPSWLLVGLPRRGRPPSLPPLEKCSEQDLDLGQRLPPLCGLPARSGKRRRATPPSIPAHHRRRGSDPRCGSANCSTPTPPMAPPLRALELCVFGERRRKYASWLSLNPKCLHCLRLRLESGFLQLKHCAQPILHLRLALHELLESVSQFTLRPCLVRKNF